MAHLIRPHELALASRESLYRLRMWLTLREFAGEYLDPIERYMLQEIRAILTKEETPNVR